MAIRKRLKYPEAAGKEAHYGGLVQTLNHRYKEIQNGISTAKVVDASILEPSDVEGEYYDYYIRKREEWIGIHGQQIAAFESFLRELDTCIDSAGNLKALWAARVGIMEEYNDD